MCTTLSDALVNGLVSSQHEIVPNHDLFEVLKTHTHTHGTHALIKTLMYNFFP